MSDIKLKDATRAMADRIKAHLGVDEKHNLKDDKIFDKIAVEDGIDLDRMRKDDEYRSDYISALHLAAGEVAREHMKKNKDVTDMSGSFEMGRGQMDVSFTKHKRVPNRILNKETGNFEVDGEKDRYGDSVIAYHAYGAKGSRGELKKVREYLSDHFASAFGK